MLTFSKKQTNKKVSAARFYRSHGYCFLMPSFVVFNDPVFLTLTWFYGSDPTVPILERCYKMTKIVDLILLTTWNLSLLLLRVINDS